MDVRVSHCPCEGGALQEARRRAGLWGQGLRRKLLLSCAIWFPKEDPRAYVSPDGSDSGDRRLKRQRKGFLLRRSEALVLGRGPVLTQEGGPSLSWEETREEGVEQAGVVGGRGAEASALCGRRGKGEAIATRRVQFTVTEFSPVPWEPREASWTAESQSPSIHPLPPRCSPEAFRSLSEESENHASE